MWRVHTLRTELSSDDHDHVLWREPHRGEDRQRRQVTFLNSDARPHAMSSDPFQVHTDCPAINDVGFLNPGQQGSTGVLTAKRTCGFHDHTNETDPIFKGRIIVE